MGSRNSCRGQAASFKQSPDETQRSCQVVRLSCPFPRLLLCQAGGRAGLGDGSRCVCELTLCAHTSIQAEIILINTGAGEAVSPVTATLERSVHFATTGKLTRGGIIGCACQRRVPACHTRALDNGDGPFLRGADAVQTPPADEQTCLTDGINRHGKQ